MKKNLLISALYKLVFAAKSDKKLIAWDFPARNFKVAFNALKKFLAEKDIPIYQPEGLKGEYADWPHFSVAFVPEDISEDKIEKIKLAGPIYASPLKTKVIKIFPGKIDPSVCFIVWELEPKDSSKIEKMKEFVYEIAEMEKPQQYYTPHVSLAVVDVKYLDELKNMVDVLNNLVKRFSVTYTPQQLQVWQNFRIIDIESLKFK